MLLTIIVTSSFFVFSIYTNIFLDSVGISIAIIQNFKFWIVVEGIGLVVFAFVALRFYRKYHEFKNDIKYENLVQKKQNQLRSLIDAVPDSIYIKDLDGKFVVANLQLAKNFGKSHPKEIIGKSDFDFFDPILAQEYRKDEVKIHKTGIPLINKEETGRDENGVNVVKSVTKVAFRDNEGKIIGLVGISRNITKQKETERRLLEQTKTMMQLNEELNERQQEIELQSKSLKKQADTLAKERNLLFTLINNMPDYIYIKDKGSRFILANKKLTKILKAKSLDDIITKTDHDFYPREIADIFRNDEKTIIETDNPIINKEEVVYDEDGNLTFISTTKVPFQNESGETVGIVGIGRDISKQKQTERDLIEQSQKLEEANELLMEKQEQVQQQSEELKAQADNLQEINVELNRLNKTKNKFFSIIAHDLKNPFHAILGFTDILIRQENENLSKKQTDLLQLIKATTENAYNLLENLLHWARTQTQGIRFSPAKYNVSELLMNNIRYVQANAENKGIKINTDIKEDVIAYFDMEMINTVLRNILNNAIKFTNEKGRVDVSCKNLDDFRCSIQISDNGIGIPKEKLNKLFKLDQYYTTTGTAGETGTGLGLIISKEFIQKNNGTISVQSEEDKGTTFTVTLPVSKREGFNTDQQF